MPELQWLSLVRASIWPASRRSKLWMKNFWLERIWGKWVSVLLLWQLTHIVCRNIVVFWWFIMGTPPKKISFLRFTFTHTNCTHKLSVSGHSDSIQINICSREAFCVYECFRLHSFPWQHTHHLRSNTQFSAPLGCPTNESSVLREHSFWCSFSQWTLKIVYSEQAQCSHTRCHSFTVHGDSSYFFLNLAWCVIS